LAASFEKGTPEFRAFMSNNENGLNIYRTLNNAGCNFMLTDANYLQKFSQLKADIQPLIAKFTDDKAGSTLCKFLDDCDDDDFLRFVNNVDNKKFTEAFLNHKLTDDEVYSIGDLVAELREQDYNTEKIENWLQRSERITEIKGRFKLADDFENANNIRIGDNEATPCNTWAGNGNRKHYTQLQVGDPKVIMDDALVDPVSIAIDTRGRKTYRTIYHDSKLSSKAPWTENQNSQILDRFTNDPALQFIDLEVKSSSDYFSKQQGFLKSGDKIRIYRNDIYKSISNGNGQSITQTIQIFK